MSYYEYGSQLEAIRQAEEEIKKEQPEGVVGEEEEINPYLVEYTIFASGINNGGRFGDFAAKNTKDDVALVFDAIPQHSYSLSYKKTSYAVESKSFASDHVVTEDGTFSFTGYITDSPLVIDKRNFFDVDTDKNNPKASKRPEKALELLKELADKHHLITLVTEDNILTDYVITKLSAERSTDAGGCLTFSVEMQEFRFKLVSMTVLANTSPKKAGKKQGGNKQSADKGSVARNLKGKDTPFVGGSKSGFDKLAKDAGLMPYAPDRISAPQTIKPTDKFSPDLLQRK